MHTLDGNVATASQHVDEVQVVRTELISKKHALASDAMHSNRFKEKLVAGQTVVLRHSGEQGGGFRDKLKSWSHSHVRFHGDTEFLINCCLCFLALTMVLCDGAADVVRKKELRASSQSIVDNVFLNIMNALLLGMCTDIKVLYAFLILWSDKTFRDIAFMDRLHEEFVEQSNAMIFGAWIFVDIDEARHFFTQIILRQIQQRSQFWIGSSLGSHFNPADPQNSDAGKAALRAMRKFLQGLYPLLGETFSLKYLENAFRCFDLFRWLEMNNNIDKPGEKGNAAKKKKKEFEECHRKICNARQWEVTWLSFLRLGACAMEHSLDLPEDQRYSRHLQCWKDAVDELGASEPSINMTERRKVAFY